MNERHARRRRASHRSPLALALALACATPAPAAAQDTARAEPAPTSFADYQVRVGAEAGFLAVASNFGVFGADGTRVDLRRAAGQDNLSFYTRWTAELELGRRHTVVFLYQPLSTEGARTPASDVRFEGVTFAAGAPFATTFSFPFYRASYLYDLVQRPRGHLSVGLSGQIRNARYEVQRLDGTAYARVSDVGFVPALKARGALDVTQDVFVGFEVDGIYAPISILNGSTNETTGAIVDASIRAGVRLRDRGTAFLNLRYLGGGATNEDPSDFAKNWLHFFFVGLGASLEILPTPTRPHGWGAHGSTR